MINSYEQVYRITPMEDGDHVSLEVTHNRGSLYGTKGYEFRVQPFFNHEKPGREYHVRYGANYPRISHPCGRQSKRRYESAKESSFAFILSETGLSVLRDCGIELLEKVSEREWDCYA